MDVSTAAFLWTLDVALRLAARVPWPLALLPVGFLAASIHGLFVETVLAGLVFGFVAVL
jgi:hypothetical protein